MAAIVMLLSVGFVYCSGFTAFAAVDLDVTLVPPPESVQNNGNCPVELDIVTKSANGYVELVIKIEYDADLLALAAPVNQNGYKVTGSRGQLTLTYFDPTGTNTPTPIGNTEAITINFTVLENAPDTTTKIKATVDHAYNSKGKNITWTPIYDKTIEIIRINDDIGGTTSSETEDVSSQFVVGKNIGTVTRTTGTAAGSGKVAGVLFGALVIFGAGVLVGYIVCMKKYGIEGGLFAKAESPQSDYDNSGPPRKPIKPITPRHPRTPADSYDDYDAYDKYDDYDKYAGNNDDGFYTKPGEEYTISDDSDDYFTSASAGKGTGGNYMEIFTSAAPMGSRSLDPADFGSLSVTGSGREPQKNASEEDEYPSLFRQGSGISNSTKPFFDESEDSIFGKFSGNVERNVDDGYGGLSSRSRDRSERARRNR